jgi:probable rRNA maturation factor
MICDVICEDERWESMGLEGLCERGAVAVLAELRLVGPFEIAVLGCDDGRIAALNGDFRDKNAATNVLSWPSEERGDAPGQAEAGELGDLALAYETCVSEAQTGGILFADHVQHLVIHGMLHLLGYDHIRDEDATVMEAIEISILGKMGIPDPYRR